MEQKKLECSYVCVNDIETHHCLNKVKEKATDKHGLMGVGGRQTLSGNGSFSCPASFPSPRSVVLSILTIAGGMGED